MTPVQSQPIGQYPLAPPALAGSARPPTPTAAIALNDAFSPIRSTIDGVQTGFCERQPPNPIVGGPVSNSPDGGPNAQPNPTQGSPTQGSTGNSFLDLISQLMSQLDSFISGLGTNASGGSAGATPVPVSATTSQPNSGNPTSEPDPGVTAMQQLLATGDVT